MTSSPTPMTRGYIMTLCGGLCWAIGGACGQVMFRDCGVTSDWLVPIRLFTGGIITLLIAALTGRWSRYAAETPGRTYWAFS